MEGQDSYMPLESYYGHFNCPGSAQSTTAPGEARSGEFIATYLVAEQPGHWWHDIPLPFVRKQNDDSLREFPRIEDFNGEKTSYLLIRPDTDRQVATSDFGGSPTVENNVHQALNSRGDGEVNSSNEHRQPKIPEIHIVSSDDDQGCKSQPSSSTPGSTPLLRSLSTLSSNSSVCSSTYAPGYLDNYQSEIFNYYITQNKTLAEVLAMLGREYKLPVTLKMLKTKLKQWEFTKYISRSDMSPLLLDSRMQLEPRSNFRLQIPATRQMYEDWDDNSPASCHSMDESLFEYSHRRESYESISNFCQSPEPMVLDSAHGGSSFASSPQINPIESVNGRCSGLQIPALADKSTLWPFPSLSHHPDTRSIPGFSRTDSLDWIEAEGNSISRLLDPYDDVSRPRSISQASTVGTVSSIGSCSTVVSNSINASDSPVTYPASSRPTTPESRFLTIDDSGKRFAMRFPYLKSHSVPYSESERLSTPSQRSHQDNVEYSSDDELLDSFIGNLIPRRNTHGEDIYFCVDAQVPGHCCDYEDKRKCNLRQHLESTLRPNICLHPECKLAEFSSKAVLTRHEKETHGMHKAEQFFCPIRNCERATRAFPREYNMCDHITRVHKEIDVGVFMRRRGKSNAASKKLGMQFQALEPGKTESFSPPQKRKQFQCIFCDVGYTTKSAWIRHETELHESPKKWQCPDCKATFLNQNLFTKHHSQNHSCRDCRHANEAKIELPRKTAWACGLCATLFQTWEKRCEHVALHFIDGHTKDDWDFGKVISGLLTQKWVTTAWQSLLAKQHGTNAEDHPVFKWQGSDPSCLELLQDLEHGQGEYEVTEGAEAKMSSLEQLVRRAYILGTSESLSPQDSSPVLPGDSESIANQMSPEQSKTILTSNTPRSGSLVDVDDTSSLDECSDDDYDTDEEESSSKPSPGSIDTPSSSGSSPSEISGQIDDAFARAVGPLLDSVVTTFLQARILSPPDVRSHASSEGTNKSAAHSSVTRSTSSGSSGNGGNKNGKRGRDEELPIGQSPNDGPEDGDGNDPNKRIKDNSGLAKSAKRKSDKRYACPYYQRDPKLYGHRRSCIGPGWIEVHRIKDHLYKHHVRPTQCRRCWEEFENDSDFDEHQNADERCSQNEQRIAQGFDKKQEKLIRSKKRFQSISDPDEKWRHVYRILFPLDDESRMPSPYYSVIENTPEVTAETSTSGGPVQRFEQYWKRTIPKLLKESLKKHLQSDSESAEVRETKESIERMISSIFPEVMEDMFQRWHQLQQQQTSASSTSDNNQFAFSMPTAGSSSSSLQWSGSFPSNQPLNSIAQFYVPPPPPTSSSNSISISVSPWQHVPSSSAASDSGYMSTGTSSYSQTLLNGGYGSSASNRSATGTFQDSFFEPSSKIQPERQSTPLPSFIGNDLRFEPVSLFRDQAQGNNPSFQTEASGTNLGSNQQSELESSKDIVVQPVAGSDPINDSEFMLNAEESDEDFNKMLLDIFQMEQIAPS